MKKSRDLFLKIGAEFFGRGPLGRARKDFLDAGSGSIGLFGAEESELPEDGDLFAESLGLERYTAFDLRRVA